MRKSKSSEGSELVLAYLEDAQRVRATLFVVDPKGREVPASLVAVTEERVTLAPQGTVMADKGGSVGLLLYLDGLRLKASGRVQEVKGGSLTMDLPGSLQLAERRKSPRARLNPREGATATALTGLFDGIGLAGNVENLSERGFALRVERAMNVKTQGRMNLGGNLISRGDLFMIIKLNKLPKCPPIEVGGTAAHAASEGNGLLVGFEFEDGKESILAPVKALVASRTSALPSSVPPKARRSQEAPSQDPQEEGIALAPARPPARKEPEPPAPSQVATPAEPPEPPTASPTLTPDEPAEAPHRSQALLRVKKRARGILLAMPEGDDRDHLAAALTADGYGRVRVAATLTELLEVLDDVQLVFVDGGVAELQGLPLASLLHQRLEGAEVPVVLAEGFVDAELVLGAQEVGVAQVLVKPYDLDADFLRMIEGHLGIG